MQKQQLSKATRIVYTILRQIATLIPREFVKDAAEVNKVKWRTFDPWSHLLTLVIVQLSRQESLNGICDVARALAYEWDSGGGDYSLPSHEKPVIPASFELRQCAQWDADTGKPAKTAS